MARDLQHDMETLRSVLDLAQQRNFEGAAALAQKTLASGFEHPMLLNVVATRLEQQGKFEDALKLLDRAVAIAPNDIGARNALGMCLQQLDRPAEALFHLDMLLNQHPDLAFAHANKGNALISLGSLGRAKQSHLRALELEPGNYSVTAALASIATHRGQHEEARGWAERTLKVAPGFPDAILSLAAADLASGDTASAQQRLQQLIIDSRAGHLDRARATGLLADVLDATGRYGEAFDAYQACNQALRKIHQRFAGWNMLGYTRALTPAMQSVTPNAWQLAADENLSPAAGHVFLLGFPRSGTTLLEVVLDGNPRTVSLEERELLAEGVMSFMREPLNLEPLAQADAAALRASRAAYWRAVSDAGVDVTGKVFVDKHPLNTLKLPLIVKLFPSAKILFAVRDPRDVLLSCFRRRFKMNPAMYELLTLQGAAALYGAVMESAITSKRLLAIDWHLVRYETLVSSFEQEMSAVCDFIGLDWMPSMGEFANSVQEREFVTPSTAQLSRGLVTSAMAQWRHYATQLQPLLPMLKPWMEQFGYS